MSPDYNGLVNGTQYLRGSLREPTEVLPEALARGCGPCSDLYQQIAASKLAASPTPRNVTVSTCGITTVDTILQVLRFGEPSSHSCAFLLVRVSSRGSAGAGLQPPQCSRGWFTHTAVQTWHPLSLPAGSCTFQTLNGTEGSGSQPGCGECTTFALIAIPGVVR